MNDLLPMLDLFRPVISAMGGDHGKVVAFVVWVGTVKTVIFPAATFLQGKLTEILMDILASPEQDDDAMVERLLRWAPYRVSAYLLKWLTSFKLPTMESWQAIKSSMG